MERGSFAQYKQEFSIGEIRELRWEIVSFEGKLVEIEIRSHGLVFNTSTASFDTVPGGGTLIIDKDTWEIQEAHHTNGTEIDGYPIGELIAFWISPETNESTPINTMYENNVNPTLSSPIEFDCLSAPRTCWMTENIYSAGNYMHRYYDQHTGVVLMIETCRTIYSANISILETLNGTNIGPLMEDSINLNFESPFTVLIIALPILFLIVLVVYIRKKRDCDMMKVS
ncbi:MAG: hypothetical protein PVG65_04690 [Candidatus Thorarchaeota archaeon]